jgi:hypothetical protein
MTYTSIKFIFTDLEDPLMYFAVGNLQINNAANRVSNYITRFSSTIQTPMLSTNDPTRQDESCYNFTHTFNCVLGPCTSGSYPISPTPVTFVDYPSLGTIFYVTTTVY